MCASHHIGHESMKDRSGFQITTKARKHERFRQKKKPSDPTVIRDPMLFRAFVFGGLSVVTPRFSRTRNQSAAG
jgi:hypothetical protein